MKENLAISTTIDTGAIGKAYDNYCKKILSNKQIIAHIMKECVSEYADIPLEDIPKYIESDPETNVNMNSAINGDNTEDETIPGAVIRYDVLFEANLPKKRKTKKKEKVSLFINIEAQNQEHPGYPLISRAIYYCSRLLDKQKNAKNGFQHSNYGDIKKVYSIWLCILHSDNKNDVINTYSIKETCMKNEWKAPKEHYDLMKVIMIYPGKKYDYDDENHTLLKLLNILFISDLSLENKKAQLQKKYGIIMTQEVEKEVADMCNLSQGIMAKGIQQGIQQGIDIATVNYVKKLMKKNSISAKEAMDMLDVEDNIRPVILEELQKQMK